MEFIQSQIIQHLPETSGVPKLIESSVQSVLYITYCTLHEYTLNKTIFRLPIKCSHCMHYKPAAVPHPAMPGGHL